MTPRRPGYALIELLVVLTISAIMLGLSAGLIHLLLKLDHSGRMASDQSADLARLARDFRADAHASAPVEPADLPKDRLILALEGGRTVEYLVRPKDVLRTVREGEKVRHFETYRRPVRASIRLEATRGEVPPFATLVIDRPPAERDDARFHDYRIEAELGKDRRLNPRAERP